jgi:L-threonylcarbamoyladenylate synthase
MRKFIAVSYVTDRFDDEVVRLLKTGGAGLLPSDTIYGLSCLALDGSTVEKLHRLKARDGNKPFIVLISDIKMLDLLSISKDQADVVKRYWPGALSLEFQTPNAPAWLHRGLNHFAIRMPDYPDLLQLIDQVGPIVSTSANLQGETPVNSVAEARQKFGDQLDFYVDAGELNNPPSTLAVVKDGRLLVERQGAVKIDEKEQK